MKAYTIEDPAKVEPLNIEEDEEEIDVGFDPDVIKAILAKHIYDDPKAGFRELYANAIRSCREAKEKYNTSPRIELIINPKTMNFAIQEYDSMGITRQTFKEILAILGKSSNFDGKNPGQFGIGIAAYYALSDTIMIETRSRETGERLCYLGRNLRKFTNITKVNPSTFDGYGSKMSLKMQNLKPDENMRKDKISNYHLLKSVFTYLTELCEHSDIQTNLIIEGGKLDTHWGGPSLGTHWLGPVDIKKQLTNSKSAEFIEIKNDDYTLIATTEYSRVQKCLLAGMPISFKTSRIGNWFSGYVLNVLDERKYKPAASRDGFSKEAEAKLNAQFKQDIIDYAANIKINTIEDWVNAPREFLSTMETHFSSELRQKNIGLHNIAKIMGSYATVLLPDGLEIEGLTSNFNYQIGTILMNNLELMRSGKIGCMRSRRDKKVKAFGSIVIIPNSMFVFNKLVETLPNLHEMKIDSQYVTVFTSSYKMQKEIIDRKYITNSFLRVKKGAQQTANLLRKQNICESVFAGTSGGTDAEQFVKTVFGKKYDNITVGKIIKSKDYCIIEDGNKFLHKLDAKKLGGIPICINRDELVEIQRAAALSDMQVETFAESSLIYLIGQDYGVNFHGCETTLDICKILDKIQNKKMRSVITSYLVTETQYVDIKDAKRAVAKAKRAIKIAMQEPDDYSKAFVFTMLLMSRGWNGESILRSSYLKSGKNAIAKFLSKGNDFTAKRCQSGFDITIAGPNFSISHSRLKKLDELNLPHKISNIRLSELKGKPALSFCLTKF